MPARKNRPDKYNQHTRDEAYAKHWLDSVRAERNTNPAVSETDRLAAERHILSPTWSYGVEEDGTRASWLFINLPQELIPPTEAIQHKYGVTVRHGMYGATLRVSADDYNLHIAPHLRNRS